MKFDRFYHMAVDELRDHNINTDYTYYGKGGSMCGADTSISILSSNIRFEKHEKCKHNYNLTN